MVCDLHLPETKAEHYYLISESRQIKKKNSGRNLPNVLSLGGKIMVTIFPFLVHFPNFLNDQTVESMLNSFILNKVICTSHCCLNVFKLENSICMNAGPNVSSF